jgi:2'-5' RNA ligase
MTEILSPPFLTRGNLKRLFIALTLSEEMKTLLHPFLKKLKSDASRKEYEIHWTREESLHITLFFLGNTADDKISELTRALDEIAAGVSAFEIEVRKMSAFPDEHHARALFLGISRNRTLVSLQEKIKIKIESLGFTPDPRPFTPHITFGRLKKSRSMLNFLSPFVRKNFGDFTADHLMLFQSEQRGPQTVYTPIHRVDFSGAPSTLTSIEE